MRFDLRDMGVFRTRCDLCGEVIEFAFRELETLDMLDEHGKRVGYYGQSVNPGLMGDYCPACAYQIIHENSLVLQVQAARDSGGLTTMNGGKHVGSSAGRIKGSSNS